MAATSFSCWYGSIISQSRRAGMPSSSQDVAISSFRRANAFIHEWIPFLLVASYFIFSTCMYTFCTEALIRFFWFTYLVLNFYIAGSTFLESIMSLTPTRDARKALSNVQNNG